MTSVPIPVAVIGAGRVARAIHLPLLAASSEFEVSAVVETDGNRRASVARAYPGLAVHSRLDPAVKAGARAVLCATPWPTHASIVAEALGAGLPVLCEKPVSLDPDELTALAEAERRAGVPVAVAYMRRHDPVVAELVARAADEAETILRISVDVVDPNAPHQLAHLAPPEIAEPVPRSRAAGDRAVAGILGEDCPPEIRAAYAHGLGGSLIHHVNLVHACLAGTGRELTGWLGYARVWAGGGAVACGWFPSERLAVQLSHVRAPGHHSYHDVLDIVTRDRRLSLTLPSPYLLESCATLAVLDRHAGGEKQTVIQAPPGRNGFVRQLQAWARTLDGGPEPGLPGLPEAAADLRAVGEAVEMMRKNGR